METEQLVKILYLVNKCSHHHILSYLKSKPLCLGIDTIIIQDQHNQFEEKILDLYHHLKKILDPWSHAYIQLPSNCLTLFLPQDHSRGGERILHIKKSGVHIIGNSEKSILSGRIRIGENVNNVTLQSMNIQRGSWGITVDEGSEVRLQDLQISNCTDDAILIQGQGTTCSIVNCTIKTCGECGLNIDNYAIVNVKGSQVSDCNSDAICVSGGAQVDIDIDSNAEMIDLYTAEAYDDSESRVYAVRAEGKRTKVNIRGASRKEAHRYFKSIGDLHSPMRELHYGVITFSKKRRLSAIRTTCIAKEEENEKRVKKK